jgi:hypothetical protein
MASATVESALQIHLFFKKSQFHDPAHPKRTATPAKESPDEK